MNNHKFVIDRPAYGELDLSNPQFIFRIVDVIRGPVSQGEATVTEDGLEDPDCDDFFVVHYELPDQTNFYVCEFRGVVVIAKWAVRPMGFKGISNLDTGYFYAPYIPMTQTPTVLDPNSFAPRKGILKKYGKKLLAEGAKFYGKVTVTPGE